MLKKEWLLEFVVDIKCLVHLIEDPYEVETSESVEGMELLDINTVFEKEKSMTTRVKGEILEG